MPRTLRVASVQMDATPAPTSERLARADALVAEAASSGAKVVVLPEVFNTGYAYDDANYSRAEPIDGETVTWMQRAASANNTHVVGTLLLQDSDEVYNAALLIAPDGRTWRYDKQYPWGWERAYFREGQGITIAHTDLGRFGLMICWDYAHPELWERYAGQVDAILMPSSPPAVSGMDIKFKDGVELRTDPKLVYKGSDYPFGGDLDGAAAWMRVPVVVSTGAGRFRSKPPRPYLSTMLAVFNSPRMWSRITEARNVTLDTGYFPVAKVIDNGGQVVARVEAEGDGYTVGEITLADAPPQPVTNQLSLPFTALAYVVSDVILPLITAPLYRRGYRDALGEHMAPPDHRARWWRRVAFAALVVGYILGRFAR